MFVMAGLAQFVGKPMLCLISEQPMPNLIAVKLLKPSYLIILHTGGERFENTAKILQNYTKKILSGSEVAVDVTNAYSVQENYTKVNSSPLRMSWIR